jgi:hypothetical protein
MYRIQMFIGALALIAVAGVGSFFYLTRDIAAPSENVQDSVAQITTSEASEGEAVFRISQADSQAEYNISEVLNGSDKLVVGTTNQVAGDLLLNLSDPTAQIEAQLAEAVANGRLDQTQNDEIAAQLTEQITAYVNGEMPLPQGGRGGLQGHRGAEGQPGFGPLSENPEATPPAAPADNTTGNA